jgi:hypothetical protein
MKQKIAKMKIFGQTKKKEAKHLLGLTRRAPGERFLMNLQSVCPAQYFRAKSTYSHLALTRPYSPRTRGGVFEKNKFLTKKSF